MERRGRMRRTGWKMTLNTIYTASDNGSYDPLRILSERCTASQCWESRAQTDQSEGGEPVQIVLIGWLGLGVRRTSEVEQMFQPPEFSGFGLPIPFSFFALAFPLAAAAP